MIHRSLRLSSTTDRSRRGGLLLVWLLVGSCAGAQFDTVINLPGDPVFGDSISGSVGNSNGLSTPTTQLNVADGGSVNIGFHANSGSEVNVLGGSVGRNFSANSGSEINISGGSVGNGFDAHSGSKVNISGGSVWVGFDALFGSKVNISGGSVGGAFNAFGGSEVNISGGTVGNSLDAYGGSVVNLSGGAVGNTFEAKSGSVVNLSGGIVGRRFDANAGSEVQLIGGEFLLNDAPFTDATITLGSGDVFTGTLSDGSPFVFSPIARDRLIGVELTVAPLPLIETTSEVVSTDVSFRRSGLRAGQTLTLQSGGVLGENFTAVDATLNVRDGSVDDGAEAASSEVNISGGSVGRDFNVYSGSVVNISGGTVGSFFDASNGSEVNISGGALGFDFIARSGSVVNISGGTVGVGFIAFSGSVVNINGGIVGGSFAASFDSVVNISGGSVGNRFSVSTGSEVNLSGGSLGNDFDAFSGSEVNISGGSVGDDFDAFSGSVVNLLGVEFLLDGELLRGLTPGESLTIAERGGAVLSGTLADGSPFEFTLNGLNSRGQDFFDPDATLTVTLAIPEPTSAAMLVAAIGGGLVNRRRLT